MDDRPAIPVILTGCGGFSDVETVVAMEMVEDGLAGDYKLLGATIDDVLWGYACMGPATLSESAWYLYWICIHVDKQRQGLGRLLQSKIEQVVRDGSGTHLVLETSGRGDYARARNFYRSAGFTEVGRVRDFYKAGDDCVTFCKYFD